MPRLGQDLPNPDVRVLPAAERAARDPAKWRQIAPGIALASWFAMITTHNLLGSAALALLLATSACVGSDPSLTRAGDPKPVDDKTDTTDPTPGPTPVKSSAQGLIPAELVGAWTSAGSNQSIHYDFRADGTFTGVADTMLNACSHVFLSTEGVAVFDSDGSLTQTETKRSVVYDTCGSKSREDQDPTVITGAWELNPRGYLDITTNGRIATFNRD